MKILGCNLNNNKNILYELIKVYGIGYSISKNICLKLNILNKKVSSLSTIDINNIISYSKQFRINNTLKDYNLTKINNLIRINSYKGYCHLNALPVRGQRTRTNAKTVKKIFNKRILIK